MSTGEWTWTRISITGFMGLGVLINGSALVFLLFKNSKTMFHRLLKILAISDLIVDISCGILWGVPQGSDYYSKFVFPCMVPYLIPISQMAVMSSNFCTGVMGFERFVRFKFICRLKYRSWIASKNFCYYVLVIVVFPVLFYFPKFFELTYVEKHYDCSVVTGNEKVLELLYLNLLKFSIANPKSSQLSSSILATLQPSNKTSKHSATSPSAISPELFRIMLQCVAAHKSGIQNITFYHIEATELRKNRYYYHVYFVGANTLFGYLIPFGFLVVLNVLIVRVLNAPPSREDMMIANSIIRARASRGSQTSSSASFRHANFSRSTSVMARSRSPSKNGRRNGDTLKDVQEAKQVDERSLSMIRKFPMREIDEVNARNTKGFPRLKIALSPTDLGLARDDIPFIDSNHDEDVICIKEAIERQAFPDCNPKSIANSIKPNLRLENVSKSNDPLKELPGGRGNRILVAKSIDNQTKSNRILLQGKRKAVKSGLRGSTEFSSASMDRTHRACNLGKTLSKRSILFKHHSTQEARLTRISLSIICLYLICHIWKLIPTFYEAIHGDDAVWPQWLSVIKDLSHVLIVFNSATNFLLYLVM